MLLDPWPHSNTTVQANTNGGLLKFEDKGTEFSNSVKRDTAGPFNFVAFQSDLGQHVAVSSIHGSEELFQLMPSPEKLVIILCPRGTSFPFPGFPVTMMTQIKI